MTETNHIIEPERYGIWIAVTFIITLLSLGMSLLALDRTNDLMYMTQTEILLLSKKIDGAAPAAKAPAATEKQEAQ